MLVVRSERYGRSGELRSSWFLDSIHILKKLNSQLFNPEMGFNLPMHDVALPHQVRLAEVPARVGFTPVLLPSDREPVGFRLVDIRIEHYGKTKAVRFVYSDGIESFSLLEAAHPKGQFQKIEGAHAEALNRLDTEAQVFTSAEANLVHWQDRARLYTLIGSMPASELLDFSKSIVASTHPRPPLQRPHPVGHTTAVSRPPPPPPHPPLTFGEILYRGWVRFIHFFGL